MRTIFCGVIAALCGLAVPALADCVNYSKSRADKAAAALARNPPSAQQLGMPTLDGLALDAPRTVGDPVCDGPTPKRFYYTTSLSLGQLVNALYPNIRRRTETDGMKRTWYRNPKLGNRMFLTSGTELDIQSKDDGSVQLIKLTPLPVPAPLVADSQPYAAQDIASGRPWPAPGKEFVRADGAEPEPRAAAPSVQPGVAGQPSAKSAADCPPKNATGAGVAAALGAEVGGLIQGGGSGRSGGAALGSMLGGFLGSQGQAPAPAPQSASLCP